MIGIEVEMLLMRTQKVANVSEILLFWFWDFDAFLFIMVVEK